VDKTGHIAPVADAHAYRRSRVFAIPRLSPRLTLVTAGTLLQTISLIGWMSAPTGSSGPTLAPWPLTFLAAVVCFVVTLEAPAAEPERAERKRGLVATARSTVLLIAVAISASLSVWAAADVIVTQGADPAAYVSDAAAFNHFDAQLVLSGRNPYTADDAFWSALRQFPTSAATPLRRGQFAADIWPPDAQSLRTAVRAQIADPTLRDGSFAPESLHSYPALSFLLYVPGVWAGLPSTLPISLLGLCGLLLTVGLGLPAGSRVLGWGLLLANAPALLLTMRGSFEAFAILPLVLAWQFMPRRWLSPALVGFGCAVKQVVWPLAPLYLIVCARRYGWREAVRRGGIALAAFAAPNLPFIVLSPAAWARSMLLPLSLPLFPDGIGLVGLAQVGVMPLLPQWLYAALELVALGGVALWLAKRRRALPPEVALPLGLLVLALAWRSLLAYFVWLPALVLVAVVAPYARRSVSAVGSDVVMPARSVEGVR
jgi:hypothetical protein